MPIYEYQCNSCGHEFEMLQGLSEPTLVTCPQCSQPQLRLKLSTAAFHLKGTGWYETDFKNKEKKKPADSDKAKSDSDSSSKDTQKSSEKSSEKKSADTGSASDTAA